MFKGSSMHMKGFIRNGLYVINAKPILGTGAAITMPSIDNNNLWYRRSLSSAIDGKTLIEKMFGKVSNYDTLKVFGCAGFAHQNIGKLEPRSKKCVFLGYADGVKDYKL
ncbi:Retrovirus-related Pol polyprotein from transposon TNT 1-94 [Abeliophyllum distichum]|uniref:Retrovirus-related Pol polyprotein from transposon TNT 1-94 n=1 Tax=Abeliophyllum distichum TaxID=126358 RepID=A0ABD1REK1_9LAMI